MILFTSGAHMSTVFDQRKSFNTNAWSIVHRSLILQAADTVIEAERRLMR
jgi:hypothetical protein